MLKYAPLGPPGVLKRMRETVGWLGDQQPVGTTPPKLADSGLEQSLIIFKSGCHRLAWKTERLVSLDSEASLFCCSLFFTHC